MSNHPSTYFCIANVFFGHVARLQVLAACNAQKVLQSCARLIVKPVVIASRSRSASVYVSPTPPFGVNTMNSDTREALLSSPAYMPVASWILKDMEARKREHLLEIAFVTWKGNTRFMPALISSSSSEQGDDGEWPENAAWGNAWEQVLSVLSSSHYRRN